MTADLGIAIGAAAGLITAFAHAFVLISKELRAWRTLRRRNASCRRWTHPKLARLRQKGICACS
jgi:hypothetical protein